MKIDVFGYTISINKALILIEDDNTPADLKKAIEVIEHYGLKAKSTEKQKKSAQRATKARSDKAIEKINNAINLLHLENRAITHYSISQASGVSYNTVKKHIPDLDIIGKL